MKTTRKKSGTGEANRNSRTSRPGQKFRVVELHTESDPGVRGALVEEWDESQRKSLQAAVDYYLRVCGKAIRLANSEDSRIVPSVVDSIASKSALIVCGSDVVAIVTFRKDGQRLLAAVRDLRQKAERLRSVPMPVAA
jgi:hypothetical protein